MLGVLYSVLGAALALSYVPQALAAWRERGALQGTSLGAWTFWTLYGVIALAYAATVLQDSVVVAINASSLVGCAVTTGIIASKRLRYRRCLPVPPSARDNGAQRAAWAHRLLQRLLKVRGRASTTTSKRR